MNQPGFCPACGATAAAAHYLEDISCRRTVLGRSADDSDTVQINAGYRTDGCDDSPTNPRFFCTVCGHWWSPPAGLNLEFV